MHPTVPTVREAINQLRETSLKCLEHMVGLGVRTSTHMAFVLSQPSNLSILECNEGDINTSHHTRLQLARHLLCFVIFEQASKKNKNGANIDLNQLEEQLNNIHKASPGMGSGEAVDLDHPMIQGAVETPDVPEATQKAVRQVLLSTGELGLLTALKNGTWVYGLQKTGLVFSIDFTAAAICSSILRRPNVMYKTTNLTPKGIDPFQQLEVILEAEVLCFLHAVQVQHPYSFPPGLQEVLDAFGVVRSALGDLSADDNILPNVCAQPSWKEGSCLFKAGLFLWMLLSVLILQIAGPSLLRTGRVCLYLWSSDHAVRTDHGVHRLYRWPRSDHCLQIPLLLKIGLELGSGAHGTVKRVAGTSIVVKIGRTDIIKREASVYSKARQYQGLPILQDFGVFDFESSAASMLVLEYANPIRDTPERWEVNAALQDIHIRLGFHHRDIDSANMLRGVADGKLKIIDFAKGANAADCDKHCILREEYL
ncbi:hypothetical protein PC9H_008915 [Pleurotus ostreatus]|uniref:Protein kinase domain-containing protein n=1 Tax=Pleurotus ostreatus TaxID=5322 RepID=A0A8H6ZTJ2_PLEOS|nr:uncharacterized protein PC9H_008915 [Pleurotus ostreatus]KAF7426546.1 hypothetical protein PC9H_008915 [Pleurotus ostreatus]